MSESRSSDYGCNVPIGLGSLIAVIISWHHWHNIWWLILHGLLGWLYVIYYLIKYGPH